MTDTSRKEILEEYLRLAAEAAQVASWEVSLPDLRLSQPDFIRSLFNLPEDSGTHFDDYLERIHPDDRAHVKETFIDAVERRVPWSDEYRVVTDDGVTKWFRARGRPLYDHDGRPLRFLGATVDVTEEHRTLQALAESDERYRSFVMNSSEAIWRFELREPVEVSLPAEQQIAIMFEHGQLAEANDAMARMYGYERGEEIIGTPLSAMVVPDDPANIAYLTEFVQSHYRLIGAESTEVDRNGVPRIFVNNLIGVVENGKLLRAWGTQRDVTRQKQQAERGAFLSKATAILGSSLNFDETLSQVANLIVPFLGEWCAIDISVSDNEYRRVALAHHNHQHVDIAQEADSIYRLPPEEDPILGVIASGEARLSSAGTQGAEQYVSDPHSLDIIRQLELASWMIVPMKGRDRTFGAITIIGDRESRRVYDDSDLEFAKELASRAATAVENARLYSIAQAANVAKDEFLATVSHELRTPLTSILGWVKMLKIAELDDPTYDLAIDTIERSARAQAELIEDLLDLSQIVTGKFRLKIQSVDLVEIVTKTIDALRPTAEVKGIALSLDVSTRSVITSGDPARLQQIIWNLLSNAIKFSSRGGSVVLSVELFDHTARIKVKDQGHGIDPKFVPHVFERFRQADSSSMRRHGGLGLGLSIAKQLVELHAGEISVESEGIGKGATFSVELPITTPPATTTEQPASTPRAKELQGIELLIVDDEEESRRVLSKMLQFHGATVVSAGSVAEALPLLSAKNFSIVLTDIAMPGEDGFALLRHVREMNHRLPVIAVTALGRSSNHEDYASAGFVDMVAKPVDPEGLGTRIRNLLDGNRVVTG